MTVLPAPPTEPASLQAIAARVDARLTEVLAAERARWLQVDPDLAAPLDTLATMLAGGKRLRAAFCHWGFVAAGGAPDDPRAVEAGVAFELLQAFALIHDDVMDGSAVRRGNRTTHLQYADLHADGGWLGEDRRFGEGIAILVGDMAYVLSDRLMRQASDGRGLAVWDELRLELNMGQYLDMVGTARRDTRLDRAHLVARYKSGKYTVERPLHIGAALCGRLDDLGPVLSAYGDPVGEAFQLRDDLLDVYGEEVLLGKPIGGDLREGKQTALLAATIARCPGEGRDLLARVGDPGLTEADVVRFRALMDACGSRSVIEENIADLTEQAVAAIADAPIDAAAIEALTDLAHHLAARMR